MNNEQNKKKDFEKTTNDRVDVGKGINKEHNSKEDKKASSSDMQEKTCLKKDKDANLDYKRKLDSLENLNKQYKQEVEKLRKQVEDLSKQNQSLAEHRNSLNSAYISLRSRMDKDIEIAKRKGLESFLLDFVSFLDSYEQANSCLKECEKDMRNDPTSDRHNLLSQVIKGVIMSEKVLDEIIKKYNIQPLGAPGEKLDPEKHNALGFAECKEFEGKCIAQVLRKGYCINGRLIRPADVLITKDSTK